MYTNYDESMLTFKPKSLVSFIIQASSSLVMSSSSCSPTSASNIFAKGYAKGRKMYSNRRQNPTSELAISNWLGPVKIPAGNTSPQRTTPVTDSSKDNHLGMMLSISKGKHSAQMTLNTSKVHKNRCRCFSSFKIFVAACFSE